jgi:hypothetical protein
MTEARRIRIYPASLLCRFGPVHDNATWRNHAQAGLPTYATFKSSRGRAHRGAPWAGAGAISFLAGQQALHVSRLSACHAGSLLTPAPPERRCGQDCPPTGHSDFGTTRRYVHPNMDTGRAAMEKAREVQGGHKSGHNAEKTVAEGESTESRKPKSGEDLNWYARVDSNHRPFAPEAKSRCQRANSLTSRDLGRRVGRGTLGRSGSLSALLSAHSSAHGSPLALNLMSV